VNSIPADIEPLIAAGDWKSLRLVLDQAALQKPNAAWILDARLRMAKAQGDVPAEREVLERQFLLLPHDPFRLEAYVQSLLALGMKAAADEATAEHEAHVRFAIDRLSQWWEPAPSPAEDALARATRLYLDLLERTVSNWIYGDAQNRLGKALPFDPERRETGRDIPMQAHTMIGLKRLRHLRAVSEGVLAEGIAGAFVEAGVWRGGACILMAGVLKAWGATNRAIVAADSFRGLPAPDERFVKDSLTLFDFHLREELSVGAAQVRENFERYGLWSDDVHLLEGYFRDTLPSWPFGQIAVLRMDGDLYSSTMDTLVHLYDHVSPGGYVISDDYGVVIDARRAVLDFRRQRGITAEMFKVDGDGVFWRKES
jgi:O-methyltransferase